jgi:hypothetical protein
MPFVVRPGLPGRPEAILFETDDLSICVGQVSLTVRRGWEFHFGVAANCLKPGCHAELKAFGDELVALRKIKDRMLV